AQRGRAGKWGPGPTRPATGSAVTATMAIPTYASTTVTVPLAINLRSAPRPAFTSPANPDADSTLVKAMVVTVSAKISPDQVGALPRCTWETSLWALKDCDSPIAIAMSSSTSA